MVVANRTGASCDAGMEPGPSAGSCAKCAPGTFKAAAGPEACAPCPINSFAASGRADALASATFSLSEATTSVEGDEISVSALAGRDGDSAHKLARARARARTHTRVCVRAYSACLQGMALSPTSDILYLSDRQNNKIKRVELSRSLGSETSAAEGIVGARFGSPGSNDGVGTRAKLKKPGDVAIADDGRILYVADTGNHLVRPMFRSLHMCNLTFSGGCSGEGCHGLKCHLTTHVRTCCFSPDSQGTLVRTRGGSTIHNIVTWSRRPKWLH